MSGDKIDMAYNGPCPPGFDVMPAEAQAEWLADVAAREAERRAMVEAAKTKAFFGDTDAQPFALEEEGPQPATPADIVAYVAALPADERTALLVVLVGACTWSKRDGGPWESACGAEYEFVDAGPDENGHVYCHKCGARLTVEVSRV